MQSCEDVGPIALRTSSNPVCMPSECTFTHRWGRGEGEVSLYLLQTWISEGLLAYPQLISRIEEGGLETEGLLRIPGAAMRIKVTETLQFC